MEQIQDKSPLRHHKKVGWGFYPNDNKFVGLKAQPTRYTLRHHIRVMSPVLKVKKIEFERRSFHYVNENSERVQIEYNKISSLKVILNVEYCRIINHSLLINILLNDETSNSLEYVDYDLLHSAACFPVLFNIIDNCSNIPNFCYEIKTEPTNRLDYTKAQVEYYIRHHKVIPWYYDILIRLKYGNLVSKIVTITYLLALVAISCSLGILLFIMLRASLQF